MIEGIRAVEPPASSAELVTALQKVFQPIAPSVHVYRSGNLTESPEIPTGPQIIRYA